MSYCLFVIRFTSETQLFITNQSWPYRRCNVSEECIETIQCSSVEILLEITEEEKCKPNFGSFTYSCCKVNLSTYDPESPTDSSLTLSEHGIETTLKYSNEDLTILSKSTLPPGVNPFITGSGLFQHLNFDEKKESVNPYQQDEHPIQLIETEKLTPIATTPLYVGDDTPAEKVVGIIVHKKNEDDDFPDTTQGFSPETPTDSSPKFIESNLPGETVADEHNQQELSSSPAISDKLIQPEVTSVSPFSDIPNTDEPNHNLESPVFNETLKPELTTHSLTEMAEETPLEGQTESNISVLKSDETPTTGRPESSNFPPTIHEATSSTDVPEEFDTTKMPDAVSVTLQDESSMNETTTIAPTTKKPMTDNIPIRQYKYYLMQQVNVPSQFYTPPLLSSEGVSVDGNVLPEIENSETIEDCNEGMHCVPEGQCNKMNLFQNSKDGPEKPNQKCRQENDTQRSRLNGVCCSLADQGIPNSEPAGDVCGVKMGTFTSSSNDTISPWEVILRYGASHCKGVIISPRLIVTTGSCVNNASPAFLDILIGQRNDERNAEISNYEYIYKVGTIIKHPKYRTGNLSYNVALVVTTKNIKFDKSIGRICLPNPSETFEDTRCTAGGLEFHGFNNNKLRGDLHNTEANLNSTKDCEKTFEDFCPDFFLGKTVLCGTLVSDCDDCTLQEGTPLECHRSKTGKYELAGLATITGDFQQCKASVLPATYSNMMSLLEWMFNFINRDPDNVISEQKGL